jgi:hypothetical protein
MILIGLMMTKTEQAIALLRDDNLVWSTDFERIRPQLADLFERSLDYQFGELEPEIGDLAIKLVRTKGN